MTNAEVQSAVVHVIPKEMLNYVNVIGKDVAINLTKDYEITFDTLMALSLKLGTKSINIRHVDTHEYSSSTIDPSINEIRVLLPEPVSA
jgi:hypothetical protein